jgi:hypothetical protein
MRNFTIVLLLLVFSMGFTAGSPESTVNNPDVADTCFYELQLPPDIDVPETPYFDTVLVRRENCKVHILVLESWGTETEYKIAASIGNQKYNMNAHFHAGSPAKERMIDITHHPAAKYSGYLLACGNGGSFGLELR